MRKTAELAAKRLGIETTMPPETITATAPSAWAPYLINGDDSGLKDEEIAEADAFVAFMDCGSPVDCQDAGFIWWHDARTWRCCNYGADCQRYTFFLSPTKE